MGQINKTKEYRAELAEMFARILEEESLNWKKTWKGWSDRPLNAVHGNIYKGINSFKLMLVMIERRYTDPRWATYHQIQKMGYRLKNAKGMGVTVEYWFPFDREENRAISWAEFKSREEPFGERYFLRARYSVVFNAAHIEGLPERIHAQNNVIVTDELINTLSANMGVEILNDGGDEAFYHPAEDKIHLPFPEVFDSSYDYNSTALHELGHATGAAHRLNRNISNEFGSKEYAFEELIAEISACFMSVSLSVEQNSFHFENHKAYVQGWAATVRKKPELLIKAIAEAERVASYMEFKAGLLPESEFKKIVNASFEASEAEIVDVALYGSRSRGLEHDGSDIDFVVEYKGDVKEDFMLNPIRAEESGTLKEYLPKAEAYMEEFKRKEIREGEKDAMQEGVKRRKFFDLDGTAAVFKSVEKIETLYEKGYFENLEPIKSVIDAINRLLADPTEEVFILSSVLSDSRYALAEKNAWIDRYLPGIDAQHRIFPPCGENKLDYIPDGVRETDCLIDDYTHNLLGWEPPAKGIKVLNGINHTNGTWKGNMVGIDNAGEELARKIKAIGNGEAFVQDERPQDKYSMDASDFEKDLLELKNGHRQILESVQELREGLVNVLPEPPRPEAGFADNDMREHYEALIKKGYVQTPQKQSGLPDLDSGKKAPVHKPQPQPKGPKM